MDILDKLIIKRSSGTQRISTFDLANIKEQEELFSACEADMIEMKFSSTKFAVFIERYDSDDLLELNVNDEFYTLSEGANNLDNSYLPGQYQIQINYNGRNKIAYFTILPLPGVGSNSLLIIKNALDKFERGLWIDYFTDKNKEIIGYQSLSSQNYFTSMIYFLNNFKMLTNSIREIHINPIQNVKPYYKIESFSKKQDIHTQRWKDTQGNRELCDLFLNKKTEIYYKSDENIYLKFILKNIIYHIGTLEDDLIFNLKKADMKVIDFTQNKLQQENKYEEIKGNKKVTNRYKNKLSSTILSLISDIGHLEEMIQKNKRYLYDLKKMKCELRKLINSGFLQTIVVDNCPKLTTKFLANYNYKRLNDFYLVFVKNEVGIGININAKKMYISKRTYKLFELYNLIMVFYALKTHGYLFCDSKDSFQSLFSNIESSCYMFTNNEYKIEIRYDIPCQEELNGDRGFISQGNHNRPDIIVLIKDLNDIALRYLIIEIKCRRLNNIYVQKGNTQVMETAKDYANNIKYIENDKIKEIPKDVLIVFPEEDELVLEEKYKTFRLLSSNIAIRYEENYLYKYLVDLFKDY